MKVPKLFRENIICIKELHNPVDAVREAITDDLRIRPPQILQTGAAALIRPARIQVFIKHYLALDLDPEG